jgi:hypothetical protein
MLKLEYIDKAASIRTLKLRWWIKLNGTLRTCLILVILLMFFCIWDFGVFSHNYEYIPLRRLCPPSVNGIAFPGTTPSIPNGSRIEVEGHIVSDYLIGDKNIYNDNSAMKMVYPVNDWSGANPGIRILLHHGNIMVQPDDYILARGILMVVPRKIGGATTANAYTLMLDVENYRKIK